MVEWILKFIHHRFEGRHARDGPDGPRDGHRTLDCPASQYGGVTGLGLARTDNVEPPYFSSRTAGWPYGSDRAPPPTARAVVRKTREENVTLLAASIAYSAFVSLLPLLGLLFFVTVAIGQEPLSEQVVELTRGILAPSAQGVVAEALQSTSARAGTSLVGVVTLLWGTLKIFRGLDTAFSQIYNTEDRGSFLDQLKDSVVVLTALAFAVVVAVAVGGLVMVVERIPLVGLLAPALLLVGLSVSLFPIYYVFPDCDLSVREVLPGVILAAVGWSVLEFLFRLYVAFAGNHELYGVLGSVLLLLTWLYLSSLLLLLGGVLNAVLTGRLGER